MFRYLTRYALAMRSRMNTISSSPENIDAAGTAAGVRARFEKNMALFLEKPAPFRENVALFMGKNLCCACKTPGDQAMRLKPLLTAAFRARFLGPSGAIRMRGRNARHLSSHRIIKSISLRFFRCNRLSKKMQQNPQLIR